MYVFFFENIYYKILRILQMDEEERYNRRLESGLYTLQVRFCTADFLSGFAIKLVSI